MLLLILTASELFSKKVLTRLSLAFGQKTFTLIVLSHKVASLVILRCRLQISIRIFASFRMEHYGDFCDYAFLMKPLNIIFG